MTTLARLASYTTTPNMPMSMFTATTPTSPTLTDMIITMRLARLTLMGMSLFAPMAPVMRPYIPAMTDMITSMRMTRLMATSMNAFLPMARFMPTAMMAPTTPAITPFTAMAMMTTAIMQGPTPWSLSKQLFSPGPSPEPPEAQPAASSGASPR